MLTRRLVLLAGLAGLFAPAARADVKLHPLFSDNMVIPREVTVVVWGTADPNERVDVTISAVPGTTVQPVADAQGNWFAPLPPMKAGTGYTLTAKGKSGEVTLKNVAVGDVWLCSGQSNMEWRVKQLTKEDQGKKVAEAAANPNIRLYDVPNRPAPEPKTDITVNQKAGSGVWLECTPETVTNFSAVGYFFGRDLQKALNVPIGLIASDWGGTPAEAWVSREALAAEPSLRHYVDRLDAATKKFDAEKAKAKYDEDLAKWKEAAAKAKEEGKQPPRQPTRPGPGGVNQNTPTALYNGMIAPLLHPSIRGAFPIRGAIWYQGESNAGRAYEYRTLMPTLIRDWRARWGYEFPFLIVQLAPFRGGPSGVDYAELRDAQFQTARALPRVGLAVITDVGDETDIHPQKKEPVGGRLALAARAIAYGELVEFSGPVIQGVRFEGDKAVLNFIHVGGGLVANGDELTGFTVAGPDQKFYPAKAEIRGDTVAVSSEKVPNPVAVRYGWTNFAKPALSFFNKAGLPAIPFRTDDFPLTTMPKPDEKKK
jgi:sialate O-acetylesterase